MGLDHGSIALRVFIRGGEMPADAGSKIAEEAIQPLDCITESVIGWSTRRHLLDRAITDDNVVLGSWFRATLTKAEKKVPSSLLKAEARIEELATMEAEGVARLPRPQRQEIANSVKRRLMSGAQVSLSGIDVATRTKEGKDQLMLTTAASDSLSDSFGDAWRNVFGYSPIPLGMAVTASLMGLDISGIGPAKFGGNGEDPTGGIEDDFLTWLWYNSATGGSVADAGNRKYAVVVEGPMTFISEEGNAQETVLKRGNPPASRDARIALKLGKKLRRAKLTLANDADLSWSCGFDTVAWTFTSLKCPKSESLDPVMRFEERMGFIEEFLTGINAFVKKFLVLRKSEAWNQQVEEIKAWANNG